MTCPRCLGEGRLILDESGNLRVRCYACRGLGRLTTQPEEPSGALP